MDRKLLVIILILSFVNVGGLAYITFQKQAAPYVQTKNPEKLRELANALTTRGLYPEAALTLRRYLNDAENLADEQRASILYNIANILEEKVQDYRSALATYEEIRSLYPNFSLKSEVNKRAVACLDRMGLSLDAKNLMDETAKVPSQAKAVKPEEVLAQIGNKQITKEDLESEIRMMPATIQKELANDKSKRKALLNSLVAQELMLGKAAARNLDKDPEILKMTEKSRQMFMVQKLLSEEIQKSLAADKVDLASYYEAHKDHFTKNGKTLSFEEAKPYIEQDIVAQKQDEIVGRMVDEQKKLQAVKVFEDRM